MRSVLDQEEIINNKGSSDDLKKGGGKDIPPGGIRLVVLSFPDALADGSRDVKYMNFGWLQRLAYINYFVSTG